MVSWTRATRLVTMVTLGLQAHPHLAVLEGLLLPDRHRLLQGIDGEATGLEGFAAVRRGDRDHHARLPDLEAADAMDEGDAIDDRPAAADGRRDLPHLGERHRPVGLVLEELDPSAAGLVAYHPREERSEEHTSELQSQSNLVCRLLLEKKKKIGMMSACEVVREQDSMTA